MNPSAEAKRVAFFTDTYKPNVDGVVKSLLLLEEELSKRGVEVNVFAPAKGLRYVDNGKEVLFASLPFLPYKDYHIALPRMGLVKGKGPFDVVHNHGIALTALAALSAGERYSSLKVSTFHTDVMSATHYLGGGKAEKAFKKAVAKYLRWLYSKFDVLTAPSRFAAQKLRSIGIEAEVVPNGIRLSQFPLKREPKEGLLLHVGRVVKEKNLELLFDMVEGTSYQLVVVGRGPALSYYKRLARQRGLSNVTFTGFLPDEELMELRSRAQAQLFSSTFDTQGLVVVEALAMGLPVVAYEETAGAEVVEDFGTVFRDKDTFQQALERAKALSPAELRSKAEEYDISRIVEKWLEIYSR